MTQTAAPPEPTLENIDALLTEKLWGWKWYQLTAAGVEKAIRQDEVDASANRAHLLNRSRFLSEPTYGDTLVRSGDFEPADMTAPTAIGYEARVLPVSKNIGLAAVALQRCNFVQYKRRDDWHEVRCAIDIVSRDPERVALPFGIVEAKEFAEAAARAVAKAYGLVP
jgi:hypothetical protein